MARICIGDSTFMIFHAHIQPSIQMAREKLDWESLESAEPITLPPPVERNRNQNEPKMSDLHAATAFQPPKQDLLNHLRGVRHLKAAQL